MIEPNTQPLKELVANVEMSDGDAVGVFERRSLAFVKEIADGVVRQSLEFFACHTELTAHGGVEILSEDTPVERRDPGVNQCGQGSID